MRGIEGIIQYQVASIRQSAAAHERSE